MALNLSTLTNSATSGDVLAEALTTADFLEPTPVLRNLSRGSNKGGDAKQDVALNQPKALPLIDGKGYLYGNGVANNYASVPDAAALDISGDLTLEVDVTIPDILPNHAHRLLSKYNTNTGNRSYQLALLNTSKLQFTISSNGSFQAENSKISTSALSSQGIVDGQRITIKATWRQSDGRVQFFFKTSNGSFTQLGSDQTSDAGSIYNSNANVNIGATNEGQITNIFKGAFHSAKIYASINDTNKVLDVDFTATNIRHGDTKFKCATGQVVTVNQSGNDPSTIIKKPVLRFSDAANTGLRGLFNQTITEGYMFAAFSVLGDGNRANNGRVFSINSTGASDAASTGYITGYGANPNVIHSFTGSTGTNTLTHVGLYSEENGDILHEHKFLAGAQLGKVNNADVKTNTTNLSSISSEEFNIGASAFNLSNAAIDLEFLALFPSSITDAQADSVRNYINNRNNVFDLKDGFGYYFFDAQKAAAGPITTGSASWNGRIVGSDNGDTDKYATQSTTNDAPVSDGYVVTFADNSDHLDIPSTSQAGWQIVGTSLGTFAYRVDNDAVTELNLLGNLGHASFRKAGDLYGIILLPESATGADIEEARKLLIDRGASDGTTASSYATAWFERTDLVEFQTINMSNVTNVGTSWNSTSLIAFPAINFASATNFTNTWAYSSSLAEFRTTEMPKGADFTNAWRNTTALTSFPAGAKLGTSASNVNFSSAWQSSGLTSFPADIDLSKGTNFFSSWFGCSSLTSFPSIDLSNGTNFYASWYSSGITNFSASAKLGENAINVSFREAFRASALTSFSTPLNNGNYFFRAWRDCNALVDFSANVFANWNPATILSGIFNSAWKNNVSLSAQSVENILIGINNSGKFATTTGASGGSVLSDGSIGIDYNTATGSLSAATNTAVTSLKSKGWSIIVNNVTL